MKHRYSYCFLYKGWQPIRGDETIWRLLIFGVTLCGLLSLTPATPRVYADGGAPNLAYVAGGAQGISVIDIRQQKVTRTIALDGSPSMVYLSLDGRYLYAAQPTVNKVTMIAAGTDKVVCSVSVPGQPSLLAFDPGVSILYVAGQGSSTITALDASNCSIKQKISAGGPVYGLAMAQVGTSGTNGGSGNQLWFSTKSALNVFQLPNTIQSIAVPAGPAYISIPPGATVYTSTRQGSIVAVSLQTRKVTPPLVTSGDFGPMDFDEFTGEIYVPDKKHNQLDVLSPIYYSSVLPKEPEHVIKMPVSPQSVAITSDGNLGFVALANGSVTMLDIPGKQSVTTFVVGGSPRFIITGLYPPSVTLSDNTNANGSTIPVNLIYGLSGAVFLVLLVIIVLIILARSRRAGPSE